MRIISLAVFVSFFTMVSLTALFGAYSIVEDETKIGSMFPYHVHVPHLLPYYVELFCFALAVTWNGLIIVVHDSLFISLMIHLCCQVEVLRISLQNMQFKHYRKPPMNEIRQCINHHQLIIIMRNRIEQIFSGVLLLQFLTSLIISGMTVFQATMTDSIGSAQQISICGYCCCIIFELFLYCWFSNQTISQVRILDFSEMWDRTSICPSQSQSIIFSGFSSSWYLYDRKYNNILIMLLKKAQQSVEMTAGGFFSISLESFKMV